MVTGGVKKTRAVGNRAHTDKIGFTVLTFSKWLHVCALVQTCLSVNHVNLCMCPGT